MPWVEVLNARAAAWGAFMVRSLVEATALLGLVLLVWLVFRRRISSQVAYGLFLLVLVKAQVSIPLPLPLPLPARLTARAPQLGGGPWTAPREMTALETWMAAASVAEEGPSTGRPVRDRATPKV